LIIESKQLDLKRGLMTTKILAFAGSTRTGSVNKKLLSSAVKGAEAEGAEVTLVDLADYEMPLYNGDLEAEKGIPTAAKEFKALMKSHNGFLIASPEYNSSISPLLKNTLDWASRPEDGEKPLEAFAGKTAALLSASPGALGGLRGLVALRSILGNIQVIVLPEQFALSNAHEAFNQDDELVDTKQRERVRSVAGALARATIKLS